MIAHGEVPPPFSGGALLDGWTFEPFSVAFLLVAGGLYALGLRRVRRPPPFPPARVVAFYGGLAAAAVALLSPLDAYSGASLTAHMLQHVVLMFVAAPLLVLGAPVTLALRALGPGARKGFLLPVLHSRAVSALAHPVVAWVLFALAQYLTHFTGFYDAALESPLLHAVEHGVYLGVALLFWWPVVAADPVPRKLSFPARLLYLVLAMPLEAFIGVAILSADSVLYPHYETLAAPWGGAAALADQGRAGALMWITGDLVALTAGLLVAAAWFRHDEARQRRIEEELDRRTARAAESTP